MLPFPVYPMSCMELAEAYPALNWLASPSQLLKCEIPDVCQPNARCWVPLGAPTSCALPSEPLAVRSKRDMICATDVELKSAADKRVKHTRCFTLSPTIRINNLPERN